MDRIKLGDIVTDDISGFTGVVVGICHYLTGCTQMLVTPKKLSADGGKIDSQWFDEGRLTDQAVANGGPAPVGRRESRPPRA